MGVSKAKKIDWKGVFNKGYSVNVLSSARFFLFASRDTWFEIGLPLFLRLELGWRGEAVGLVLAGEAHAFCRTVTAAPYSVKIN